MIVCSKCEKDKPIVNKTKWLCNDCNWFRLHNGVSRAEVYKERIKERVESKVPKVKKTTYKQKLIKQQTDKQKERSNQLSKLKEQIEQEAVQNNEYYCKGCGYTGSLDKSHILSVKHRKDLELDRNNINLLCRGCHLSWESNLIEKMVQLQCFEKDLLYISNNDHSRYNKLLLLMDDYLLELFEFSLDSIQLKPDLRRKIYNIRQKHDFIVINNELVR